MTAQGDPDSSTPPHDANAAEPTPPPRSHTPHDALVRFALKDLGRARSMLQHALPAALVRAIDWDTLTRESEHTQLRGPLLRDRFTDAWLSAHLRDAPGCPKLPLHVIFEHQRRPDGWMALRGHA
ncbi:MAG: Rpn family recombination-promoting nuclease/putative transposase, partial [Polyangiales bacterium]